MNSPSDPVSTNHWWRIRVFFTGDKNVGDGFSIVRRIAVAVCDVTGLSFGLGENGDVIVCAPLGDVEKHKVALALMRSSIGLGKEVEFNFRTRPVPTRPVTVPPMVLGVVVGVLENSA